MAKSKKTQAGAAKAAEDESDTLVDRWTRWAKNNPGLAMAMVATMSLGQTLDVTSKAVELFEKMSERPKTEEHTPPRLQGPPGKLKELDDELKRALAERDKWFKATISAIPDEYSLRPVTPLQTYVLANPGPADQADAVALRDLIQETETRLAEMKARLDKLTRPPTRHLQPTTTKGPTQE